MDQVGHGSGTSGERPARLRNDSKIGFLVEGGERWAELWAVHLAGRATRIDDPVTLAAVAAAQAAKYDGFSTPRSEYPEAARAFYARDQVRFVYRIDAEQRILSWDNAKLGLA